MDAHQLTTCVGHPAAIDGPDVDLTLLLLSLLDPPLGKLEFRRDLIFICAFSWLWFFDGFFLLDERDVLLKSWLDLLILVEHLDFLFECSQDITDFGDFSKLQSHLFINLFLIMHYVIHNLIFINL